MRGHDTPLHIRLWNGTEVGIAEKQRVMYGKRKYRLTDL